MLKSLKIIQSKLKYDFNFEPKFSILHQNEFLNNIFSEFELMAENNLKNVYKSNEKSTQLLLLRQIPEFANTTCLHFAISAEFYKFVSHLSIQNSLDNIWYGQLLPNVHNWQNVTQVFKNNLWFQILI